MPVIEWGITLPSWLGFGYSSMSSDAESEERILDLTFSDDEEDQQVQPSKKSKSKKGGRLQKRSVKRDRRDSDDEVIDDSEEEREASRLKQKKSRSKEKSSSGGGDDQAIGAPIGGISQGARKEDSERDMLLPDDLLAMELKTRQAEFLKMYSSGRGSAENHERGVLDRILCLDCARHLHTVLVHNSGSEGILSTNREDAEVYTFGEVLLKAAAMGSVACTEYLLCLDTANLRSPSNEVNQEGPETVGMDDDGITSEALRSISIIGPKNIVAQMMF